MKCDVCGRDKLYSYVLLHDGRKVCYACKSDSNLVLLDYKLQGYVATYHRGDMAALEEFTDALQRWMDGETEFIVNHEHYTFNDAQAILPALMPVTYAAVDLYIEGDIAKLVTAHKTVLIKKVDKECLNWHVYMSEGIDVDIRGCNLDELITLFAPHGGYTTIENDDHINLYIEDYIYTFREDL